jgi:hypothetical protein
MYYADPPAAPPPPPPPPPPPGGQPPGARPVEPYHGLAPVLVSFPGPEPQSRGTVAIRIILAIPHLVILYALTVAVQVVVFIAWFAALFTGRLPDFAAEFENGFLRWQTRVYAYILLLTDEYPPFALADAPYPVRIATLPGRLNRLAVLFRFILIIPAGIVLILVTYGAFTIVLFVTWVIVLINGRMPTTLHQALSAALRYYTRVNGYMFMLTSAYPGGLFGDQPAVPVYDQAFPPAPGPAFPAPPDPWRLVLSSAARQLVGWFLAIGAVVFAGMLVGVIIAANNAANTVSAADAFNHMQNAADVLNNAERNAASQTQACGQNNLPCVTKIDAHMGVVYRTFAATMTSISMPSSQDSTAAAKIAADAGKVANVYSQLGQATSAEQYASIATSSGVQAEIRTLVSDFDNLQSSLHGS